MGSNTSGQLGINQVYLDKKVSPVVVSGLINKKAENVSCGAYHTIVSTQGGDVYAWGSNEFGQCGTWNSGCSKDTINYEPSQVNFESYYKKCVKGISAGGYHSGFLDDQGNLFVCGKNDSGQLGLSNFNN